MFHTHHHAHTPPQPHAHHSHHAIRTHATHAHHAHSHHAFLYARCTHAPIVAGRVTWLSFFMIELMLPIIMFGFERLTL